MLVKSIHVQMQEVQRAPKNMNPTGPHQGTSQLEGPKIKDTPRTLKSSERKTVTYKGTPMRLSAPFSTETLKARREWHKILKVIKSNKDYSN